MTCESARRSAIDSTGEWHVDYEPANRNLERLDPRPKPR